MLHYTTLQDTTRHDTLTITTATATTVLLYSTLRDPTLHRKAAAGLVPGVLQLLASMGLRINFAKSCVVSPLLSRVHGASASVPLLSSSTYLGFPFHIMETDAHVTSALCSRATVAFFTNKPLLTSWSVLRGKVYAFLALLSLLP